MPYTDADIDRIGEGLCARTLPKAEWTHAAHFAAAVWLLTTPGRDAEAQIAPLIRAYNEAVGTPNTDSSGYHETITRASLAAARAWLSARPQLPRAEALASLLTSSHGRSDWLLAHWSRERLFSVQARRGWLEPDLAPLPFPAAPPSGGGTKAAGRRDAPGATG